MTLDDAILNDLHLVLGLGLQDQATRFETSKYALFNVDICIDGDQTCRMCIIDGISLQLAIDHLYFVAFQDCDARYLSVCLPENATKNKQQQTQ